MEKSERKLVKRWQVASLGTSNKLEKGVIKMGGHTFREMLNHFRGKGYKHRGTMKNGEEWYRNDNWRIDLYIDKQNKSLRIEALSNSTIQVAIEDFGLKSY